METADKTGENPLRRRYCGDRRAAHCLPDGQPA